MMDVRNYQALEKLKDGRKVIIRAVRPDDKNGFARGFEQLSKEAIYRRFFSPRKQFTEQELQSATEIDFVRVVALVAEIEDNGGKNLIGACRYLAIDENDPPRLAEIAFVVLDAWQGRSLGKLLFKHLSEIGRECGIKKFEAVVLSENRGMMKVFASTGLNVQKRSVDGEIYFDIELNHVL